AWDLQRLLMDFVSGHWHEPDDGIWEVRGPRRHFTHSKVMAWVAVDRAIQMAEQFHLEGPLEEWRKLRSKIHAEVLEKGYDEKRGAFTQYYGSDTLDASVLMIPLVDFLPATDPRMVSTVEAIQRELTEDGFVLRYQADVAHEVDGLQGHEGAFLACSFWLADNLSMMGQQEEATELFERLLSLRNDLGLLAEEYDAELGRQVGNFPQAFSHVSLVNSAYNLTGRSTAEMSHPTSFNLLRRARAWQSGVHPPGGSGHPLAHRRTRRPPSAPPETQSGDGSAAQPATMPQRGADGSGGNGKEQSP
ncbi:MAG TPA: glycoside hydrolase family 15 protein, partial [Acidimicrobiales bacterium]|nr:glycoside hydrolase family 15 protein [Acidimicrobiales bacterium]